jgi:hypothetical protein
MNTRCYDTDLNDDAWAWIAPAEAQSRSPEAFEHWLAELEIPVLRALVRKHDLAPVKRTQKWREPEKFAKLIADQIRARMQRGAAFLTTGSITNL